MAMTSDQSTGRFLRACRRQPVDRTPIWLMRQAGRYLAEYREIRSRYSLLEICQNPELAARVTLLPVKRFPLDAAILFSDLLLPLIPLGAKVAYGDDDGPVIQNPLRSRADVRALVRAEPREALASVFLAIREIRRELGDRVPLIGFAGAPFTLASYLIEGGGSRNYLRTKSLMYSDPTTWHALMEMLSAFSAEYLIAQIESGVQAVQVFDSWVGVLGPEDYREYVLPHQRLLFERLRSSGAPAIHFATAAVGLLDLIRQAGGDVIAVDWRVRLDQAWEMLGPERVAIQGNLDPAALLAPPQEIERRVLSILEQAGNRPGHIFSLGHGILPETPVEHVSLLVDLVHTLSVREARP
jgi:uroporphyrinogen decarboxylase